MIERYTPKCMKQLWSDRSKYEHWLKVELALLEAKQDMLMVSPMAVDAIRDNAAFTVTRINELDAILHHDLNAFVDTVREHVADAGFPRFTGEFHKNTTSYDTEDPALMLQLRTSLKLILTVLWDLRDALYERAQEHKYTLMIGRTHGQIAEPDTFGRFLLDFVDCLNNHIRRLEAIHSNELGYAKMSGAIGTYAGLDPELEKKTLEILGLEPVWVSTQIVARDRHSTYINELATLAGTLERLSSTLWLMSHGFTVEVREPRSQKQKGSSAMPHKKNPIILERMQGMSRIVRGLALMMLESISTPECRDISQSCVERVVFPDATSVIYYMLEKLTKVIQGLEIFPEAMLENLAKSHDTWAGQRLKVALIDAGIDPEAAYRYVQRLSFEAMDTRTPLRTLLEDRVIDENEDERTGLMILGAEQLQQLFDPMAYIRGGVDTIFERFKAA